MAITISHLITDGSGFKQLIYLLCGCYNGFKGPINIDINRDFSVITDTILHKKRIVFQMLLSLIKNYKNKALCQHEENEQIYVKEITIPNVQMKKIHAKAKTLNCTLNDVFLAAYARVISLLTNTNKINIPCTADLRKYANNKALIGNFTGTYNLNVKINQAEKISKTLFRVNRLMTKQKKSNNDVAGPMLLVDKYNKSSLEKFMDLYGNMKTSQFTDYTNLGIIDFKKLIFDDAVIKNAIGYSGLNKAPCFQIAVSSYNGSTTISSLLLCNKQELSNIGIVFDKIKEELLQLAND